MHDSNASLAVYQPDHTIQRGFTLLEASAGTGKTYSLTFLYLRLLLEEDLKPNEIVVVTFTNAAAAELRERIHARISQAEDVLNKRETESDEKPSDEDQAILDVFARATQDGDTDDSEVREKLRSARSALDTSVISTIHSFAGRLGEEFSTITGTPSGATLVDNLHDILDEVIVDLEHQLSEEYPDAAHIITQNNGSVHSTVRDIARTLLGNPDVQPPPDALFYHPVQDALEHILNDDALGADSESLAEALVQNTRSFLQWMADEGEQTWLQWYEDVRALKSINGNSIQKKSVDKAFEALRETHRLLKAETNVDNAQAIITTQLRTSEKNRGHLRFFSFDFLKSKHKTDGAGISTTPTGNDIPASSLRADAILHLAEALSSDAFDTLWAFHVAKKAAHIASERAAIRGVRSHAHVISDIANALRGPQKEELTTAVRKRYRAALIDEFQDTDKEQWAIFEALFDPKHAITYLIGDPKQAIYGFRGANVAVYEEVRAKNVDDDRIMSLGTNYRSDDDYNQAINGVFGDESPATFQDFVNVDSPDRTPERRMKLAPMQWSKERTDEVVQITGDNPNSALVVRHMCGLNAHDFRARCANNIAREIIALLTNGEENQICENGEWRPIRPQDCAVIVRGRAQSTVVIQALHRAGIPAVMREHESVALSPAADGLMHWLHALDSPGNTRAIRALLFSPIIGMALDEIDALPEHALAQWAEFLVGLKQNWHRFGLHASLRETLHKGLTETSSTNSDAGADADTETDTAASHINAAHSDASNDTSGSDASAPIDVMSNLLAREDGVRIAGDLMHLAEVLNTAQRRERLSIAGLQDWFARARATEQTSNQPDPMFKRRIASDEEAVEIVTAHGSKGLEYPFVWSLGLTKGKPRPNFLFHPEDATRRYASTETMLTTLRDFGKANPDAPPLRDAQLTAYRQILHERHPSLAAPVLRQDDDATPDGDNASTNENAHAEDVFSIHEAMRSTDAYAAGEDLRLLYVALTRARLRTVIYLNTRPGAHADKDPTFARKTTKHEISKPWEPNPCGVGALTRKTPWPDGTLRIEQWMTPEQDMAPLPSYRAPKPRQDDAMASRTPPIVQNTRGQRPSFSSLLHLLPDHFGYAQSGDDMDENVDASFEAEEDAQDAIAAEQPAVPDALPLNDYASGREAGTAMHTVFEMIDFEGAQERPPSEETLEHFQENAHLALVNNGIDPIGQADILQRGVLAALQTPFGGVLKDFCLADLPRQDRIDELQFFLPLGEDQESTTARAIFAALRTRKGDGGMDDAWFDDLDAGMAQNIDLHGLMIGFIDLVFRADVDGRSQYFISDYKSNRLAPRDEVITSSMFTQNAVRQEMREHHYYLQYHLYLVALHRWLRSRIPDYDYDTHIGGAYYLFVRGMEGPDTPSDDGYSHGVFFDRPPKSVIDALDNALTRSQPRSNAEAGR